MTDQEEYQQYLKDQQDQAEYEQYLAETGQSQSPQNEASVGDIALRSLDYERAAGAALLAKALGQYNPEEFSKALKMKGNIPSSRDLYERAGLADKDSIGGFLGGMATDIATSPSTYASLGSSALLKNFPKAAKLASSAKWLNPVGEAVNQGVGKALKSGGSAWYKSAFSKLDDIARDTGAKQMPSDLAKEAKIKGWTSDSIKNQFKDLLGGFEGERQALLQAGNIPFDEQSFAQPVLEEIKKLGMSRLPEDNKRAIELSNWLTQTMDNIKSRGPMSAEETNILRQRIDKNMPSMYSGESNAAKDIGLAKSGAARSEAARMSADPARFMDLGQKQKTIIDTLAKQEDMAAKGFNLDSIGAFDVGLAMYDPRLFAVKKAAEVATKQGPRTMVGSGAEATGNFLLKNPWLIKTPIRQSFVDSGSNE